MHGDENMDEKEQRAKMKARRVRERYRSIVQVYDYSLQEQSQMNSVESIGGSSINSEQFSEGRQSYFKRKNIKIDIHTEYLSQIYKLVKQMHRKKSSLQDFFLIFHKRYNRREIFQVTKQLQWILIQLWPLLLEQKPFRINNTQ